MGEKKLQPLSDLSLGDADSFLEGLLRETQEKTRGFVKVELPEEKKVDKTVDNKEKTGYEVMETIMSKYGVSPDPKAGSNASKSAMENVSESVMTATCVVLTGASKVVSSKSTDLTLKKTVAMLKKVEVKKKELLTDPLNMAMEYYKTVIHAVVERNFKDAHEQLDHLIQSAKQAFQFANNSAKISLEEYR